MRTEATTKTSGQKKGLRGKEFSPLCIKVGVSSGKGENPPVPGAKRRTRGRTSRLHYFLFLFSSPLVATGDPTRRDGRG